MTEGNAARACETRGADKCCARCRTWVQGTVPERPHFDVNYGANDTLLHAKGSLEVVNVATAQQALEHVGRALA